MTFDDDSVNSRKMRALQKKVHALRELTDIYEGEIINANRRRAVAAHEIKTPLNAVLGLAELLLEEKDPKEMYSYATDILNAAQTLNEIAETEINQEISQPKKTSFYLLDSIENITHLHVLPIERRPELKFSYDTQGSNYFVTGFHSYLSEILNNFIDNSIKYTLDGSINVFARTAEVSDLEVRLDLSVTDTGLGISDEAKKKLLNGESKRPNAPIDRRYPSYGIGIPRVKDLVEKQGGTFAISDNNPKGSIFEVSIPYKRVNSY